MRHIPKSIEHFVTYSVLARFVTITSFLLIAAGPIYQLIRFSVVTGTFSWMQTAYDEPYYINDAITSPLSIGHRALSQLPMHVMHALGMSFNTIAITSELLLSILAFGAAWVLAGTLTKEAIERSCWTFALVFAFEFFSLNFPIMDSPTLAQRLEQMIGMQWLFAADLFPYFELYRTPEPQTTWIPFFIYLAGLVRFACTLDQRLYRLLCLVTPLFVLGYISLAISAWLLFVMLSVYSIILLRLPLKLPFLVTSAITCGLLFVAFGTGNHRIASLTIYNSHLPLLRVSIVIAWFGLAYLVWVVWRNNWQLNAQLALAGACAVVPLITLNQQILTGKVVYAQQWELHSNYICLVLAFGLLTFRGAPSTPHRRSRRFFAGTAFIAILTAIIAGHLSTYRTFLPTNLVSVAEARIYRQIAEHQEAASAIVLTHFWDEHLFHVRAIDAPPVLGGERWLIEHALPPLTASDSPEAYLDRNVAVIAVGFEVLARREFTPKALREALQNDLARGECWPIANYFFAMLDCWSRFSNYRSDPLQRLSPWVDPIVKRYEEYLHALTGKGAAAPVIVIRGTPTEGTPLLGLWAYKPMGQFRTAADGVDITLYAYIQTRAEHPDLSIERVN